MRAFAPIVLLCAALVLGAPGASRAGDIYDQATLEQAHESYAGNIRAVLYDNIARRLTGAEIDTLRRVDLLQPLRADDPFAFASDPATGRMWIPTSSVKFLDDLAIAIAWFESKGCDKTAVFDYVAAMDYGNRALPPPLPALSVPDKAYNLDHYTDDVSQKILKSAMAFILLHELGHIHHGHAPYDTITLEQARAQEAEADAFAMRVLRRLRVTPFGMVTWFMARGARDPDQPSTHPLGADRLFRITADLRSNPEDFIEPENRDRMTAETIHELAGQIDIIAQGLDNPRLRALLRQRGRDATPASLAAVCRGRG